MNRILKIGLIGFSAVIVLSVLLKFFGVSPAFTAPFALPWAMVILAGITNRKKED
jgi:urea transporter